MLIFPYNPEPDEPWRCGRGWGVTGGIRDGPEEQSLQGLEPDGVGILPSAARAAAVEIPKATGGTRPLGIPTVADRVAQTAVTMVLEPLVEPHFHPDSYAYRPGRSALDAVGTARKRCWRTDWVIDLDIKAFFESMPRDREVSPNVGMTVGVRRQRLELVG